MKHLLTTILAVLFVPCFAQNKIQNSGTAEKLVAPKLTENLVANPTAASRVKWPAHPVAGKNFWQLLRLEWREMDGVKDEPFVQNSGGKLMNLFYSNRGAVRKDLRKTKIKEFQIFSEGDNIAEDVSLVFSSEEPDAIFYDIDKIRDGNPNTAGFIIGDSSDFRKRNEAVPFKIVVSKLSGPVEKIRFLTDVNGCNPFAKIEALDASGEVVDALYERSDDDREWTLTFSKPITADSFVIRGETAPSLYKVADVPAKYRDLLKRIPFLVQNFFFRGKIAELEKENIDRESIQKFHAEYPKTFLGEVVGEVISNYFQKRTRPVRFRLDLEEQGYYVPIYDSDRYDAEAGVKKHWKRHVDFFGPLCSMSGGLMTAPYLFEWGVPLATTESWTEPPIGNNRSLITISRSGARQYDKPWGFYITSFAHGATATSIRTEEEAKKISTPKYKCPQGLDFGLSPSVFKRLQYIAYYGGANYQFFETDYLGMAVKDKKTEKWSLTENGKAIKDLYEWSAKPEGKRGTFYAPILLLADYFHGNWEWRRGPVWKVWYMHPFQDGDYMFQHVNRSFDLYVPRGADRAEQLKHGWGLVNSKLGDIYDVFFANPPSGVVTTAELGKYPVVFLIGDIRFSEDLLVRLKEYVKLGGTLIINAAQDKRFFDDPVFSGVKASDDWGKAGDMKLRKLDEVKGDVVEKTENGLPLIVKNAYGKGAVVFMTPYYLLNVKNKKSPHPLVSSFLEKLQSEVCPVQVSGDIHFLLNKMLGDQWKLVLFNHHGVFKDPYRSKDEIDPSYASNVTITVPAGATVRETRLQRPVTRNGNEYTLTVPSGEICVVELNGVTFGSSPIDADPITRKGGFYEGRNPNRGIHLQYDFKQKDGDVVVDSSGKGNDGKRLDGVTYEGNAAKFDGKGSYIHARVFTIKDPVSQGALEFWAKPDPAFREVSYQILMTNKWVKLGILDGRWNVKIYDRAKLDQMSGGKVEYGKWSHIVFTWKDLTANLYVNGRKVIRDSGPLLHIKPLDYSDGELDVFLGTHHYCRQALYKGLLTGVRYYGHFLTEKDVTERFRKNPQLNDEKAADRVPAQDVPKED